MKLLDIERTLSVMLTYRCNAECQSCGTLSNPRISAKLTPKIVTAAIEQAAQLNFKNVVFTGGEATLLNSMLETGLHDATSNQLKTRLVTNGVWAKDRERAKRKLSSWIESGLDEINLSTGVHHQKYVSLNNIKNAVFAANELRIPCLVMIEKFKNSIFNKEVLLNDIELRTVFEEGNISIIESPWMPLEPEEITEYSESETANRNNLAKFGGCDSALQTYVLGTDPGMYACCGIGARLIPELMSSESFCADDKDSLRKIIFEAEQDFLKLWIRAEGTEKILNWCSEHDDSIQWENMYSHKCQACLRIYRDEKISQIIRDNFREKIPDVVFREYVTANLGSIVGDTSL